MGGKHDYTHNMGNPSDPLDHFPQKGPEDKNKQLDKKLEEEKKKRDEEDKKKKGEADEKKKKEDEAAKAKAD